MNGKQLNLATNEVMFQLSFRVFYRSHSVTSEFNIQKDIWQPLSTLTETHIPAENTLKSLAILRHFYRKLHTSWEQIEASCNSNLNFLYWGLSSKLSSRWITGQRCSFSLAAFLVTIFLFRRVFYKFSVNCFFPKLFSVLQLSVGTGTLSMPGQTGEQCLFSLIKDTCLENWKLYWLIWTTAFYLRLALSTHRYC